MRKLCFAVLLLLAAGAQGQALKEHIPSVVLTFLGGASDGLRDGAMFRCDGCGTFWNGKQSWLNKYKNRDIRQGPAFFGSTTFLVATTDGAHLANFFTHQFNSMALVLSPGTEKKSFGHIFLKALAYNAVRQAGHSFVYNVFFKQRIP